MAFKMTYLKHYRKMALRGEALKEHVCFLNSSTAAYAQKLVFSHNPR